MSPDPASCRMNNGFMEAGVAPIADILGLFTHRNHKEIFGWPSD